MRYTGSVNKFLWYFFIPALCVFFVLSRVYFYFSVDDDGNRREIADQLIRDTKSSEFLDSLILGGSNARYSLSAQFLSEETGLHWKNLSLMNEGFSDDNYWQFVNDAIPSQKRAQISFVIYSSLVPLEKTRLNDRENVRYGLEGNSSFSFIPERSFASMVKEFIFSKFKQKKVFGYPLPNYYGDFVFTQFDCKLDKKSKVIEPNLDVSRIHLWMESQLIRMHELFPSATIYFVVPSQFSGDKFESEMSKQLNILLGDGVQKIRENHKMNIVFVRQSNFPSVEMLCDSIYHANEEGRKWRTEKLLDAINSVDRGERSTTIMVNDPKS